MAVQLFSQACPPLPPTLWGGRAVDVPLGTPVNTFVITARGCIRALSAERWHSQPGLASLVAIARDVLQVSHGCAMGATAVSSVVCHASGASSSTFPWTVLEMPGLATC